MRRLLLAVSLLLVGLSASAQSAQTSAAPNAAGKVELVEGDVTVYDKAKKPRRVAVGDAVFEGEGIVTGRDSELHLNMEDGGFVAVRPSTKMSIVAYRAEGNEKDKSVLSLLEGTFRSVTGWIGKFNPRSYQVRTPTATIGVRGTDHEPLVITQGSREGEPGSYDKVNVGATTLRTQHGSVEVRPDQAGFVPLRGQVRPRVLSQVPAFFRATRHEAAIAARHEAVRRAIDQRRDERRKMLQERKAQLERQKADRQQTFQERRKHPGGERRQHGEERRGQWQENRQQRLPDAGERRKHFEERHLGSGQERDGRGRDRPQRIERDHGPRGGGRGRD